MFQWLTLMGTGLKRRYAEIRRVARHLSRRKQRFEQPGEGERLFLVTSGVLTPLAACDYGRAGSPCLTEDRTSVKAARKASVSSGSPVETRMKVPAAS